MSVAKRILFERMAKEDQEAQDELIKRAKAKKISIQELELNDTLDELMENDHA